MMMAVIIYLAVFTFHLKQGEWLLRQSKLLYDVTEKIREFVCVQFQSPSCHDRGKTDAAVNVVMTRDRLTANHSTDKYVTSLSL
jgi:hypothetical protein